MIKHIAKLGRLTATLVCLTLPTWVGAQGAVEKNAIESIEASQQGGNIVVKLGLRHAPTAAPSAFSVATPPRIAFDLPGTENALGKSSQMFNESDLKSANVVQVGERTRVVFNLNKMTSFETRVQDKSIIVTLSPQKTALIGTPLVSRFAESRPSDSGHNVKNISFRRGKNGEGRIVVDLSDGNTGIDIRQQGNNLVVDFLKANIAESLKKTLDVADFGTPVTGVSTLTQGDNVRMIVTPKGLWEHNAYQSDNQFVLEVKQVIENPNKLVQGSRSGYGGEKLSLNFQNIPVREVLAVVADFSNFNIVVSDTVNGNITLVLKEVPWDQALDIILQSKNLGMRKNGNVIMIAPVDEMAHRDDERAKAEEARTNVDPIVSRTFQINYAKALDVQLFITGGLVKTSESSRTTAMNGSQSSSASASITNQGGVLGPRGSVSFDAKTNLLFVRDTEAKLEEIANVIRSIDIPARQVLIEARIVVANDTFFRTLGARLGFSGAYSGGTQSTLPVTTGSSSTTTAADGTVKTTSSTSTTYGGTILNADGTAAKIFPQAFVGGNLTATGYASGQLSTTPSLTDILNVNLPASAAYGTPGQFAMSLYSKGLSRFIDLEISALEADQKGKVVSSPRILTANQVEALIEQGTEIPYSQSTSSGATSTAFRKANLSLKVKPQITPDGNVQMELEVNKDTVGITTLQGIAINTKHVKTNVQVENGGTVVIGGIYEEVISNNVTKIPLLGDIPYLGNLFKSTDKTNDKTELLIFITPKVVSDNLSLR